MDNYIGLDDSDAVDISEHLNDLLANYQIFYQNLRGFHWNVKGSDFFQLHAKFEEIYTAAAVSIDEVAERILTLDHIPMHSYSNYIKASQIKEATNVTSGKECVSIIRNNVSILIKKEKALMDLAAKAGDEGTTDLISTFIAEHEKLIWMLSAYLK